MTTIYERKLHAMHLDEGLLSLILSEVSTQDRSKHSSRKGIGLKFLQFLEREPECAREAAAAGRLPQHGREVIAHKLALEFLGWGYAKGEISMPVTVPSPLTDLAEPAAPAKSTAPHVSRKPSPVKEQHSEYRVVFGCKYERRPHDLSPPEGENSREKGGEQNAEVSDQ